MFYNRIEIKKAARALLKSKEKESLLVGLSFTLPFLVSYATLVIYWMKNIYALQSGESNLAFEIFKLICSLIIFCIIFSLTAFAMCRWTIQLAKSADKSNPDAPAAPTVKDFFKFMTPFSIGLFFWFMLKVFLIELLLIPAMIPFAVIGIIAKNASLMCIVAFGFIGSLLFVFVILIIYAKVTSYYMAFYALADNPKLKVTESTKVSLEVTKGFRENLFVTYLSFYGWFLLGIVTLGIGYIWIIPYLFQTFANSWLFMKNEKAHASTMPKQVE